LRQGLVLVVDDDTAVRKALQRLLQAMGFEVESLASAQDYLRRPPAPRPACIVLDIRMPGMTGFELRDAIAGTERDLPVVFITGHGDADVREQAMGAGAVDVLFKPVDERCLRAAVEKALAASPP
jgi:FixJ family two-component response regulator